MRIMTVVMPVLQANCYLVGSDEVVIVDPGAGGVEELQQEVARAAVTVTGIALTHGHPDHFWSAGHLAAEYGCPVYIHTSDAERLVDPFGFDAGLTAMLAQVGMTADSYVRPTDIRQVTTDAAGGQVQIGSLTIDWIHAPGHTPGASVLRFAAAPSADSTLPPLIAPEPDATHSTVLTGDVLFAGSIGRMDLDGGDEATMARTLRNLIDLIEPQALLLPGHGPGTTMAHERARNPYLSSYARLAD